MKIIIFHRAPTAPKPELGYSLGDSRLKKEIIEETRKVILQPMTNRIYTVTQPQSDQCRLRFQFNYYRKPIDHTISVPLIPMSYWSFWHREGLGRVDLLDETLYLYNATAAALLHEFADIAGILGRILITSNEALLYLRGCIPNVEGFDNIIVKPHEHCTWSFANYSPEAARILDDLQNRRDAAANTCLYTRVSELEHEVAYLKSLLAPVSDNRN